MAGDQPESTEAMLARAERSFQLGRYGEARGGYERVLASDPANGRAILRLQTMQNRINAPDAGRRVAAPAQTPAIVIPSMRSVGAFVPYLKRRSSAGVRWANISTRLPAMVISATGSASAPSRIMKPAAPRL